MFSQACVCPWGGVGVAGSGPMSFPGGISNARSLQGVSLVPGPIGGGGWFCLFPGPYMRWVCMSRVMGGMWYVGRGMCEGGYVLLCPGWWGMSRGWVLMAPSGGHHMYSRQEGGRHPTEIYTFFLTLEFVTCNMISHQPNQWPFKVGFTVLYTYSSTSIFRTSDIPIW